MENMKMYLLIYELKGVIESLQEFAEHDEEYYTPLNEKIESKLENIIQEIENKQKAS
ncbi:hypothetical protein [Paraliobacillus sp. X-1268]|uniref:hypothetical protein n=1 Tax=Paraliobacillus sp. X-1268 TaxID=2213193 RepID=UPI001300AE99|nr:hypothetical protein [Paraliobacillus sp. X-1268]